VCAVLSIILSGPGGPVLPDNIFNMHAYHRSEHCVVGILTPPSFCSAVIKLVAMQMSALGVSPSEYFLKIKEIYVSKKMFSNYIFYIHEYVIHVL